MKSSPRPELKAPVLSLAAKLAAAPKAVPLADLAALFGADEAVLARVRTRGDIVFRGDAFSNDGPDLCVPAGKIELEIPSLLRGTWRAEGGGFRLTFPMADFTVRACATIAILRKCFDLREITATPDDLTLDFGGGLADRRYTF
jgi:hypothetical protein